MKGCFFNACVCGMGVGVKMGALRGRIFEGGFKSEILRDVYSN